MKKNVVLVVLAALLAFGLISCGEKAPDGDPANAAAAGVMISSTPMCVANALDPSKALSVASADASDFSASAYYDDVLALPYIKYKAVFDRYSVNYNGRTYEMNGTLYFAYEFTSQTGSADDTWKAGAEGIFYAEGLSVSGPDFDSAFDADCEASIGFSMTSGSGSKTISATATLSGMVAGREYSNEELSIFAAFQD